MGVQAAGGFMAVIQETGESAWGGGGEGGVCSCEHVKREATVKFRFHNCC